MFGALLSTRHPTLRAVDAAGAAHGLGAILQRGPCRQPCRFMEVASAATDAVRWAADLHRYQLHAPPDSQNEMLGRSICQIYGTRTIFVL